MQENIAAGAFYEAAWDDIKTMVIANADAGQIKRKAIELGMTTLRDDGFVKVLSGKTSLDEVLRATQEDTVEI